ncbi:hypothetical protein EV139_0586 [Leucobacter luti]|uniref:Uncharacterized protein n=1 Tax=Leucobacter luti TaxID=340320 RepID=A0A4Q7U5G0_9MICO|nr:hypothetical protein [Leucobacter luti]MBL3700924.1 hypothetical protein [Leucobacter luti]RZT68855.1 hypothetical protein EV139_0586 [Leucobacter luti]
MCQAVVCRTCNKTTWSGCGQHIDSVRRSVPAAEWCDGSHTPAQLEAASAGRGPGFLARLFAR